MVTSLQEVLEENGYAFNIRRKQAPSWAVKFLSWFSRDVQSIYPMIDAPAKTFVNTRSQ